MADSIVRAIFQLVDNMSKGLNNIDKSAKNTKKAFKDFKDEVPGLDRALELVTNPLVLAGAGIAAFGKFAADSTKETMDYAKSVRDMAEILNIGTEETSRIIQTADDYGISIGNVETALKMALKNGFAPTVDTLADMADKYNEIQDPTERAATLTKVFGRNWSELTPMLREGGDEIRKVAAAQSSAMLITEDNAAAAEEYRRTMDTWEDTLQGVKYTLGNELIPVLNDGLTAVNEFTEGLVEAKGKTDTLRKAEELGIVTEEDATRIRGEMALGIIYAGQISDDLTTKIDDYNTSVATSSDVGAGYAQTLTTEVIPAIEGETEATDLAGEAMKSYTTQLLFSQAAEGLTAEAALALARELGLVDERTVFATQRVNELKTAYDLNKDGAIDAEEAARGYTEAIDNLDSSLAGLPKDVYVNIYETTHKETIVGRPKDVGGEAAYQHGADFVVPPGYPNDSFPMRVESGERVIVQTKQQQAQKGAEMSGISIGNLNIYAQPGQNGRILAREFLAELEQKQREQRNSGIGAIR